MHIDKQTAAKWQINFAIRSIFAGECSVATHVIIMATKDLLHQYAASKDTTLLANYETYIKAEHHRNFRRFHKERYNFFKHSDHDADAEIDITNVHVLNEFETFMNIHRYVELFQVDTGHMRLYTVYMFIRFPNWMKENKADPLLDTYKQLIQKCPCKNKEELCALFQEIMKRDLNADAEHSEVTQITLAEQEHLDEREAGMDGKFFTRARS